MIRAIRWIGELEVEGTEDAGRMFHAYRNGEPVDVDGRTCLVVSVQAPKWQNGLTHMRIDVEEVLP